MLTFDAFARQSVTIPLVISFSALVSSYPSPSRPIQQDITYSRCHTTLLPDAQTGILLYAALFCAHRLQFISLFSTRSRANCNQPRLFPLSTATLEGLLLLPLPATPNQISTNQNCTATWIHYHIVFERTLLSTEEYVTLAQSAERGSHNLLISHPEVASSSPRLESSHVAVQFFPSFRPQHTSYLAQTPSPYTKIPQHARQICREQTVRRPHARLSPCTANSQPNYKPPFYFRPL